MKNDKTTRAMPGSKKSASDNTKKSTAGKTNRSSGVDSVPATDRAKARTGHGLANEGTNVSYEEER